VIAFTPITAATAGSVVTLASTPLQIRVTILMGAVASTCVWSDDTGHLTTETRSSLHGARLAVMLVESGFRICYAS